MEPVPRVARRDPTAFARVARTRKCHVHFTTPLVVSVSVRIARYSAVTPSWRHRSRPIADTREGHYHTMAVLSGEWQDRSGARAGVDGESSGRRRRAACMHLDPVPAATTLDLVGSSRGEEASHISASARVAIPARQGIMRIEHSPFALLRFVEFGVGMIVSPHRADTAEKRLHWAKTASGSMHGQPELHQALGPSNARFRRDTPEDSSDDRLGDLGVGREPARVMIENKMTAWFHMIVQRKYGVIRRGRMLDDTQAKHDIKLLRKDRCRDSVSLDDAMSFILWEVFLICLNRHAQVDRSHDRTTPQQDFGKSAGATTNFQNLLIVQIIP